MVYRQNIQKKSFTGFKEKSPGCPGPSTSIVANPGKLVCHAEAACLEWVEWFWGLTGIFTEVFGIRIAVAECGDDAGGYLRLRSMFGCLSILWIYASGESASISYPALGLRCSVILVTLVLTGARCLYFNQRQCKCVARRSVHRADHTRYVVPTAGRESAFCCSCFDACGPIAVMHADDASTCCSLAKFVRST